VIEGISKPTLKRLPRLLSLDLIRGLAAFFMVHGHFMYQTMSLNPKLNITNFIFFFAENFFYTPGWTMFFLIIGIGLAISIERQKLKNIGFGKRLIHFLKRTGIFVIIQYFYNLVNFGLFNPFFFSTYLNPVTSIANSNLIAQIGLWSLVVFFLTEIPIIARIPFAVIFAYFGYYVFHVQGNMLFYILAGSIFGSALIKELLKNKHLRFLKITSLIAIIFFLIGVPMQIETVNNRIFVDQSLFNYIVYNQPWKYYELVPKFTNYADYLASPGFIFYSIGIILGLFAILFWYMDINNHNPKIFRPLILWGNLTLTLYVTHFIFLYRMLFNLGFIYYFTFLPFMIWTLVMSIFIYIGAVFWSRYKFKYSLEWILRKFS